MSAGDAGGATRDEGAFVIVGRVRKPQGLHGEVLVEPITDAPDATFASGARVHLGTVDGDLAGDGVPLTIARARAFKDGWLLRLEGFDDRSAVETWRGRFLLLPRDAVTAPGPNEVYLHDLRGMRVHDEALGDIGAVGEVYELPQGVTLEVERAGASVLVPYRPEIIREVDLDERVVRITAPPGLLD